MEPRPINEGDFAAWADLNPRGASFTAPGEIDAGIEPCPALITDDESGFAARVIRVPWVLDEIELVHLAKGGTLWLSTWNDLPVHSLCVEAPRLAGKDDGRG